MGRGYGPAGKPDSSVIGAALAAMSADELRELVRDMLLQLDDRAHGRIVNSLIERAARNASGWTLTGPCDDGVSEIVSFAEAAMRVGYAKPAEIDDHLREVVERMEGAEGLERAWREAPSMLRLRRWLGSSGSKAVLARRSAKALEVCASKAQRQRALLGVLLGDHESAAKLLGAGPGLGWFDSEHPGHLLFPLFQQLLGGAPLGPSPCGRAGGGLCGARPDTRDLQVGRQYPCQVPSLPGTSTRAQ